MHEDGMSGHIIDTGTIIAGRVQDKHSILIVEVVKAYITWSRSMRIWKTEGKETIFSFCTWCFCTISRSLIK